MHVIQVTDQALDQDSFMQMKEQANLLEACSSADMVTYVASQDMANSAHNHTLHVSDSSKKLFVI